MKKWIALALTLSMLFPLCACASQEPPTQTVCNHCVKRGQTQHSVSERNTAFTGHTGQR